MRDGQSVMVTGGAGYIGSHAVLALLDAGYRVVVVDNLVTGFDWAVDPRATLVVAAIEDDGAVRDAMRAHDVGAVMHFAGSVVVPESVADPLKYYRNNTAASRSLIESAVACDVEITQRAIVDRMRGGDVGQHRLGHQLRHAIGIDRQLGRILAHRNLIGNAIGRGGR